MNNLTGLLLKQYLKVEPDLMVFGVDDTEKIKGLESAIAKTGEVFGKTTDELRQELNTVKRELKVVKDFQKRLDHIIDNADVIEKALNLYYEKMDKESREASKEELEKELEGIGIKIAKEAWDFATHSGRKTIKAEDIEIASKKIMEK